MNGKISNSQQIIEDLRKEGYEKDLAIKNNTNKIES